MFMLVKKIVKSRIQWYIVFVVTYLSSNFPMSGKFVVSSTWWNYSFIWAVKRQTMSTTKFVYIRNQRVRYMTTKLTKLLCYSTVVVNGNADSHQRRRNKSEKIQKIQKTQPRPNKHENEAFTYVCRRTSKI